VFASVEGPEEWSMRAAVLVRHGSADRAFEIRELPDPVPTAEQVRIAVDVFGLNFGDVMARLGMYPDAPALPSILGFDAVGRVDAVGGNITHLRPGMRVVAMTRFGAYATKAVATRFGAVPIPDDLDAAEATALATQYVTAWFAAMEQTTLQPGDRVLIHSAAGGVGTALVQIAKMLGCVVFGTTSSRQKLDYLRRIGVDYPINRRTEDVERACLKASGGKKFDVVFDSIGGGLFRSDLHLLHAGGRVIGLGIAGMSSNRPNPFRALRNAIGFGLYHPLVLLSSSRGMIGINLLRVADETPAVILRCLTAVVDRVKAGQLRPIVGKTFSVDQLAEVHEHLASRASVGKIALAW
jgi:NADPH:quinone reductase-like Zn-dependent oxidoreductase